jgi:hypothetical protein
MLMETLIKLIGTLLFLLSAISMIYVWACFERYRGLWPKHEPIGVLSRIRTSIRLIHDQSDASDECRVAFVRLKNAILAGVVTVLLMAAFVLILRSLGVSLVD